MNMKRKISIMALAAVLAVFSGCNSEDEIVNDEPQKEEQEQPGGGNDEPGNGLYKPEFANQIELSTEQKAIVGTMGNFAATLADELFKDDENVFISPISVSMTLSMIANGATGATRQEILSALGFGEGDSEALNELNRKLMCELPIVDKVMELSLANSLWIDNAFAVKSGYVQNASEIYGAEVRNVDFKSDNAVAEINEWANEKTCGMIPSLVGGVSPETKVMIANATYFKAPWTDKFDKDNTTQGVFHNKSGNESVVLMMHESGQFQYSETEEMQILAKGYGNGGSEMLIFLPKKSNTGFAGNDGAFDAMEVRNVEFSMPKFSVECKSESSLTDALKSMGITSLFSEAELSGISDSKLYIDKFLQKAVIKVDEDGSEASAATSSSWFESDGEEHEEPETVIFDVNRPFMFLIREKSTGAILFMGKVNNL